LRRERSAQRFSQNAIWRALALLDTRGTSSRALLARITQADRSPAFGSLLGPGALCCSRHLQKNGPK
jgi:hypothetical protein